MAQKDRYDGGKMNIEEIEKSFRKGIEKKRSDDLRYKKEMKERRLNEKNIPKKLSFAKKIFEWRSEFLSTDIGKKILKQLGHKLEFIDNLRITEEGFNYAQGMSRLGGGWSIKNPEEMVKALDYNLLQRISEKIESGKAEIVFRKYLE